MESSQPPTAKMMPRRTRVTLIEVSFQSYPSAADRLVSAESLGGLEVIGLGNGTGSRLLDRLRKNSSRNSSEVICNFLNPIYRKIDCHALSFFTIKDAAPNQRVSPSALIGFREARQRRPC